MKCCSCCNERKSYSDFHKGQRYADGYQSYCKLCMKIASRNSYRRNPDRAKAYSRAYSKENREKCRENLRRWIDENREHVRARDRARYPRRRQKILEYQKQYAAKNRSKINAASRRWAVRHPENRRAHCRTRQAMKRQSIPLWADFERIKSIYAQARDLEDRTGEKYEIDHIVPIKSDIVCGLHCEANLAVLKASENREKGNRTWPDMP